MKSAGKRQKEINEETYKTNVTDQDEPKKTVGSKSKTLKEPRKR